MVRPCFLSTVILVASCPLDLSFSVALRLVDLRPFRHRDLGFISATLLWFSVPTTNRIHGLNARSSCLDRVTNLDQQPEDRAHSVVCLTRFIACGGWWLRQSCSTVLLDSFPAANFCANVGYQGEQLDRMLRGSVKTSFLCVFVCVHHVRGVLCSLPC